jgi:hypothetical protein
MDPLSDRGKEPLRRNGPPSPEPQQQLTHRISNISEITDIDVNPYAVTAAGLSSSPPPPLHSTVSQDSLGTSYDADVDGSLYNNEEHAYIAPSPVSSSSWRSHRSLPLYASSSGRYAPLSGSGDALSPAPARTTSKASRRSSRGFAASLHSPIPEIVDEESYDMSLLKAAAPMGSAPEYQPVATATATATAAMEDTPMSPVIGVDLTSCLPPITGAHDKEFFRKLQQQQEASGIFTGGLGLGFRADAQMRDSDLLTSPTVKRSLSRSFTFRRSNKSLSRAQTIKTLGQDEANRLGRVIEVVMENAHAPPPLQPLPPSREAPPSADLSFIEGPSNRSPEGIPTGDLRQSTFPIKEQTRQMFFPQPNWKPWSMRWPHITLLVLMSAGLAAMQEILFQKYKDDPILEFKTPDEVEAWLYFSIKFLPTLAAVVFGVFWQFTDFEVRRLEAFYQLSKEGGALAAESINVDYVATFNLLRPFKALKVGHYTVFLSSLSTILAVSLVPTFAAAAIVLTPSREERINHPDGIKTLEFSPVWSRLLTSTLALCAVCGCGLFYLLHTRRSGLLSDVRGIAGLASMAVVSHILMDFRDMDTAKHHDIHHKLKYYRYMLRNSSLAPDKENPVSSKDFQKYQHDHMSDNPHPLMLRPAGCIPFIIVLILFTGFVPAFLFPPIDIVTDKAPWFITAWAVCLKLAWTGMETGVRMMEPYYILSKRHAPAKTLTLDYTALPFGYMPLKALLNGHFLMFLVGFGSVMAEFLTVLVTGLATVDGQGLLEGYGDEMENEKEHADPNLINAGQETVLSFQVSLALALFILVYMTIVSITVFLRRRHPFLPRQPNTIASVLAFIHQSKMLYSFVGTSKMSSAEMARRLDDGKTTYGLGWFLGRDGQTHCGVDQEELISRYKHGIDFSAGNQPWNMTWDVL